MANHDIRIDPSALTHLCTPCPGVKMQDQLTWILSMDNEVADISAPGVLLSKATATYGSPAVGIILSTKSPLEYTVWLRNQRKPLFGTLIIT